MSSNSMWRRSLLVLALGLATQAGAQTVPAAPAAPAPSPTKPSLKAAPAKPGSGMTANISVSEGSGGTGGNGQCTVTQDGTVECTGSSSGAGDGPGWYGGGGLPNEYPQGKPSTGGGAGSGSGGALPSEKEKAKEQARAICRADYDADLAHAVDAYNNRVNQVCGNLAQLKIGFKAGGVEAELDRIGAVIMELATPFGIDCLTLASNTRDTKVRLLRETRDACLAKAEKG